jgi:hypothetical protein
MGERDASRDRRESLRSRYTSLGTGELAAAATFVAVASLIVTPRLQSGDAAAMWAALTPLLVILVQAGAYWLLARRWLARSRMPASVAVAYRMLRVVNVVILVAGLLGVLIWLPADGLIAFVVLLVWAFAVVEYLNYFIVRLAYPVLEWPSAVVQWRRPRLAKDLAAARR